MNEYIDSVRKIVTSHLHADTTRPYDDLVLILDGMDKIFKVVNREKGLDSYKALFIDGFDDLTSLKASTVFTAPLSLIHVEGNALANLYSRDPYVLPMVKTEVRPENDGDGGIVHAPYEAGHDALTRLLQKRMPTGVALADVIAEDALHELMYYSIFQSVVK